MSLNTKNLNDMLLRCLKKAERAAQTTKHPEMFVGFPLFHLIYMWPEDEKLFSQDLYQRAGL